MIPPTESVLSPDTSLRRLAPPLRRAGLVLGLLLVTLRLSAQPGGPGGPDVPGGPGGPASFALSDLTASYSISTEGDVERNGTVIGTAEISHFDFEAGFSLPAPETWMFSSSLSSARDEFKLTGAVPLPEKFESVGFSFMAMKDLSTAIGPGWSAMAIVNPGFASDSGEISGDSFNLTAIAFIGKEVSPTFSWNVGLVGNTRGDMKVFPMVGLNWQFAPDWRVSFGYPRTGITYQVSDKLSLTAGALFRQGGGAYYISRATDPALNDTYVDFQEIHGGLRIEYQLSNKLSLEMDVGTTLDRTADYYDRNVKLEGKSSGYGRFSLKYQF